MVFIMLNPSTATDTVDDPTIRRCVGFARREGYAQLEVVNLFAWRATDPNQLRHVQDPVGPDNDRHILAACTRAGLVVAAWGLNVITVGAPAAQRVAWVLGQLERHSIQLYCLGTTAGIAGQPRHPLYVRGDTPLTEWTLP
jgi:hypothetical protein